MLSFLKREKSKQLEDKLNDAQRRTGWEDLPEDELFTSAGFHAEDAEDAALLVQGLGVLGNFAHLFAPIVGMVKP